VVANKWLRAVAVRPRLRDGSNRYLVERHEIIGLAKRRDVHPFVPPADRSMRQRATDGPSWRRTPLPIRGGDLRRLDMGKNSRFDALRRFVIRRFSRWRRARPRRARRTSPAGRSATVVAHRRARAGKCGAPRSTRRSFLHQQAAGGDLYAGAIAAASFPETRTGLSEHMRCGSVRHSKRLRP